MTKTPKRDVWVFKPVADLAGLKVVYEVLIRGIYYCRKLHRYLYIHNPNSKYKGLEGIEDECI